MEICIFPYWPLPLLPYMGELGISLSHLKRMSGGPSRICLPGTEFRMGLHSLRYRRSLRRQRSHRQSVRRCRDPCGVVAIPEAIGGRRALCDSLNIIKPSKTSWNTLKTLWNTLKTLWNIMKHSSFDPTILALDAETSALDVETSAFGAATSTIARRSFNATISALDAETSALDAERSALDAETSALDAETSALDELQLHRCVTELLILEIWVLFPNLSGGGRWMVRSRCSCIEIMWALGMRYIANSGLEKVPISSWLVTVTHMRSYTNSTIADIERNSTLILPRKLRASTDIAAPSADIVASNGEC